MATEEGFIVDGGDVAIRKENLGSRAVFKATSHDGSDVLTFVSLW